MEKQKPVLELELYLVRHGQSRGNVPRESGIEISLKEGHDPELTELGIKQAVAAGEYLSDVDFTEVYSSALLRAARTATEIINKQPKAHTLKILPLLTEAGVGKEYTTDFDSVHEVNKTAVLAEGYDPALPLLCYTSSSDEKALFERAQKLMEYIRSRYKNGEKVALVSHAAFITYITFVCMGFNGAVPIFDIDFKNTGLTKIKFYKEGTNPYGDIVFEYINATPHLERLKANIQMG